MNASQYYVIPTLPIFVFFHCSVQLPSADLAVLYPLTLYAPKSQHSGHHRTLRCSILTPTSAIYHFWTFRYGRHSRHAAKYTSARRHRDAGAGAGAEAGAVGLRQYKGWIDSKVHFTLTLFHWECNKNSSHYHSNPIRPRNLAARMKETKFWKMAL
jgi:hypothetical protein